MNVTTDAYQRHDAYEGAPWIEEVNLAQMDEAFVDTDSETIRLDGRPIAIMSLTTMWSEVATVIMLVNKDVEKVPKAFSRAVRTALDTRRRVRGLRKVYAVIDSSQPRLHRWMGHLGFVHEYVMKEAGPNKQDMIGYSKTFKED